jgi:hypothetical protein
MSETPQQPEAAPPEATLLARRILDLTTASGLEPPARALSIATALAVLCAANPAPDDDALVFFEGNITGARAAYSSLRETAAKLGPIEPRSFEDITMDMQAEIDMGAGMPAPGKPLAYFALETGDMPWHATAEDMGAVADSLQDIHNAAATGGARPDMIITALACALAALAKAYAPYLSAPPEKIREWVGTVLLNTAAAPLSETTGSTH